MLFDETQDRVSHDGLGTIFSRTTNLPERLKNPCRKSEKFLPAGANDRDQ
ncbi:MAG: hypothetical protein K8H87_13845 [Pseudorhodoplanes sp.]|nr:hypothetical protein [Pseudorhodoplanes sp.]